MTENTTPMNAKTVAALELSISKLDDSITNLTRQRTELDFQIDELNKIKRLLVGQLPAENRIDHLFD